MNTEIYYFSGTGNSLHLARELQRRLPDSALIPMLRHKTEKTIPAGGEVVGFIFPQYGGGLPLIVSDIIQRIDLRSASYLFAVATRGGTDCEAFNTLDRLLKKSGRRLDAFFVITMPSGSEPLADNFTLNITPDRIVRLEAEMLSRLDDITDVIRSRKIDRTEDLGGVDLKPPAFLKPVLPLINLLKPALRPLAKAVERNFSFYADENCDGCGLCETVCLSQKILMDGARPVWQAKVQCLGCFACLNYCPKEAVQVQSTWYMKSSTPANGRYHHPSVTALDIAGQK